MAGGCAFLSKRLLAIVLMEQRVLCLKITWGLALDNSFMATSCCELFSSIQFIWEQRRLMNDTCRHWTSGFAA